MTLTTGCSASTTVAVLDEFSCPVTVSGGTPLYGWTLFINGSIADTAGSLPPGLETTDNDVTFTIEGKPEQWGTYAFTVTVQDATPGWPPHTASTSFTLTVSKPS
jgi:hypothetical protein